MSTTMDEALLKLTAWLSPAYPVSAYAYSHGLEAAVEDGRVTDAATAEAWIADCLVRGAGRNDAILLAASYRAETDAARAEIAELAEALAPAAERLEETRAMGRAFAATTGAAWGGAAAAAPYPVAVGRAAAEHGVALGAALGLFVQAFASGLVAAAVKIVPLGQTEGQRILASLSGLCLEIAGEAERASLDDLGGCALLSDIASMRHETLETRIFRT